MLGGTIVEIANKENVLIYWKTVQTYDIKIYHNILYDYFCKKIIIATLMS